MIYDVYFSGLPISYNAYDDKALYNGTNMQAVIAEKIKTSPKDKFLFIVTKEQKPDFDTFLAKYELNDCIIYESPVALTNANYPSNGRRLLKYVLTAKKEKANEEAHAGV